MRWQILSTKWYNQPAKASPASFALSADGEVCWSRNSTLAFVRSWTSVVFGWGVWVLLWRSTSSCYEVKAFCVHGSFAILRERCRQGIRLSWNRSIWCHVYLRLLLCLFILKLWIIDDYCIILILFWSLFWCNDASCIVSLWFTLYFCSLYRYYVFLSLIPTFFIPREHFFDPISSKKTGNKIKKPAGHSFNVLILKVTHLFDLKLRQPRSMATRQHLSSFSRHSGANGSPKVHQLRSLGSGCSTGTGQTQVPVTCDHWVVYQQWTIDNNNNMKMTTNYIKWSTTQYFTRPVHS